MASLRRQLSRNPALWLVGLIMLLLAGVVAYSYGSFRREAARQILARDQQLAVLSASRLQSNLKDFGDLLTAVARTRPMSEGGIATQMETLRAVAPRLDVFDGGVALLDNRGRVRGTVPDRPAFVSQDWSNQDFFRAVLAGAPMFTSDAQLDKAGGQPVVTIVVPIQGADGTFVGALTGLFTIDQPATSAFFGSLVKLRLGEAADTLVIDDHGRIIFASDADRIGHFLEGAELPLIAAPQSASSVLMPDRTGRQVVAAHAPVPGTSWTLATLDDWRTVTRSTSRYRDILLITFAAALLLPPLSLAVASRTRRFRFLEVRQREDDDAWARAVRDQLHPKQLPVLPEWNLVVHGTPGKRREHEFVDAAILPDGRLLLVVGAVSGSGLPAALAIASTRTLLRACGQRLAAPDDALRQCNTSLCLQLEPPLQVRCLTMNLDPRTGWLDYACAGTSPLVGHDGYVLQGASPAGEAMGANPQARIDVGRVHLEPGDVLLVLGPAMVEARDAEGRGFLEGLSNHLLEEERLGLDDLAQRILRGFRAFNSKSSLFDPDLTILILERLRARH